MSTGIQRPRGLSDELWQVLRRVDQANKQDVPPFMKGILVENLKFTSNQPRDVIHKLSRKPRGFITVDMEPVDKSNVGVSAAFTLVMMQNNSNSATMIMKSTHASDMLVSLWFW